MYMYMYVSTIHSLAGDFCQEMALPMSQPALINWQIAMQKYFSPEIHVLAVYGIPLEHGMVDLEDIASVINVNR